MNWNIWGAFDSISMGIENQRTNMHQLFEENSGKDWKKKKMILCIKYRQYTFH